MTLHRSYPPISDYGIIGAMHTCALVSKVGSIDWFCSPAFDSPAVFGRMLDWERGGHFQIVPRDLQSVQRRYLPDTNVLETTFTTSTGVATLIDFMPVYPEPGITDADGNKIPTPGGVELVVSTEDMHTPPLEDMMKALTVRYHQKVVRVFKCTKGSVQFEMECCPRFDYGTVVPHLTLVHADDGHSQYGFARGGGNALSVYCSLPMRKDEQCFRAEGELQAGERFSTAVAHQPFFLPVAEDLSEELIDDLLEQTVVYWEEWAAQCTYEGEFRDDVVRSALALKALTYEPSGSILAAATTSLPEEPAGERNWDYRFTWIRDATFSLEALHKLGYSDEARAFKRWLEWTAASPEDLQIMYGLRGERWLTEVELPLEGYRWSAPVRIGNGAYSQFQLDIYGEVMDSAYIYREALLGETDPDYWEFLEAVVEYTVLHWRLPDAGIWETRGGYRHFLYSKVMCWVALDRGIRIAEGLVAEPGGAERYTISAEQTQRWEQARDEIRHDILTNGYDEHYRAGQGAFIQHYGSKTLDASALMLPLVGFIEANDPRMRSTIEAIKNELTSPQGFVYRYKGFDDGLAGGEGTFTICTFWLVNNLIELGEIREARALFESLKGYANDLGLFSEEIDAASGEMLGNFPQAFSHLAFIDNAVDLERAVEMAS